MFVHIDKLEKCKPVSPSLKVTLVRIWIMYHTVKHIVDLSVIDNTVCDDIKDRQT